MLKIELKEVRLNGGKIILKDIESEIFPNRVYSILGKNGSGKTTLIKALTSLLDKDSYNVIGKVLYEGSNLFSMSGNELSQVRKTGIKYVFQDAINSFDPLRTFKYYFKKISKNEHEIDELLEFFLLPQRKELYKLYPYEVSGGMAQRINFILVLSSKPQIMILDEPTSGIDSAIANLFIEKIREFAGLDNRAVLLVTHDLNFARKASDAIGFLSNQNLSKFVSPESFFTNKTDPELRSILDSYGKLSL